MKKMWLFLTSVVILFTVFKCSEDPDNLSGARTLTLERTVPSGCNLQTDKRKNMDVNEDTVFFTLNGDTLDVFAGVNYVCCAPFTSETRLTADSIIITLSDSCPGIMECYCRCMCYYSWDFLFTGFEKKQYFYKIILNDPHNSAPVIFREGVFNPN